MWRLLLCSIVLHLVYSKCPTGFDLINGNECRGRYTRIDTYFDEMSTDVVEKCKEVLGKPITIHSEEDEEYWTRKVLTGPAFAVIGLICNSTSKLWEWVDGSPLDYKPWYYNPDLDYEECFESTWVLLEGLGAWGNGNDHSATTTDIFCIQPLRQPFLPSSEGCDGFEDDGEDGTCYQIGSASESWEDAQLICYHLGANLASIHSIEENSFIRRLAVSKGAVSGLFLGAAFTGKDNKYGWVDGSEWDYNNFYPGFPIPGIGDCLAMDTSTSTGQWMNVDCSVKLPVACARDDHKNITYRECDTGLAEEGKLITSPGFPYSASMPCEYFLSAEVGKTVELEIAFLEANPCCDFLVLHDGFLGGNMIANLTGELRNVTYTSPSNLMRVSWQPNGGQNVRGMAMTFRGV